MFPAAIRIMWRNCFVVSPIWIVNYFNANTPMLTLRNWNTEIELAVISCRKLIKFFFILQWNMYVQAFTTWVIRFIRIIKANRWPKKLHMPFNWLVQIGLDWFRFDWIVLICYNCGSYEIDIKSSISVRNRKIWSLLMW